MPWLPAAAAGGVGVERGAAMNNEQQAEEQRKKERCIGRGRGRYREGVRDRQTVNHREKAKQVDRSIDWSVDRGWSRVGRATCGNGQAPIFRGSLHARQ